MKELLKELKLKIEELEDKEEQIQVKLSEIDKSIKATQEKIDLAISILKKEETSIGEEITDESGSFE